MLPPRGLTCARVLGSRLILVFAHSPGRCLRVTATRDFAEILLPDSGRLQEEARRALKGCVTLAVSSAHGLPR